MTHNKTSPLSHRRLRVGRFGFTLTEAVMSMAILAIVTLGVGAVVKTIFSHQANIVNKTESNEFVNSLGKWLQSSAGCGATFNQLPKPTASEQAFTVKGYKGYAGNTSGDDISSGFNINNQMLISSITYKDKGVAPTTMVVSGTTYTRMIAQIKINFQEFHAGKTTDMRTRYIEIPVLIGPNNQIAQCHVESTLQDACTAMGGTYNTTTGLCQPSVNCQLKGTFIVLTCSPSEYGCQQSFVGNYNNPLTGTTSCPAGASPAISGRFTHSHVVDCGKKCSTTVTDQEDFYICMQCS